ncbi:MAG: hypothetical protein EOO71_06305 [Myxococcaceae bacterium]|nr:MAG: hypothetical protein EOO71_06305 [Myxococcaceae bacterium]
MKILRPSSSATPSVPREPEPSKDILGASGNSIAVGGRGNSSTVLSARQPESATAPVTDDKSFQVMPDRFERGSRPVFDGSRPCASGSSVRNGGGHSGTVCASFVPPDGKVDEGAPESKSPERGSRFGRALAELVKAAMQAEPSTEVPAEGARGGRISTGDSSRKSGSTHSKGAQAREGAEEDAAPPQDSARLPSNG